MAALLAIVCSRTYSYAQAPDGLTDSTISGTVLNSVTHEPIGHALVNTGDERFATFTDDHGHFELTVTAPPQDSQSGVPNNWDSVQAKKPGFLEDPRRQGHAIINQKEATLSLVPEGLIVGHLKLGSVEVADPIQVQLYRRDVREGVAQWAPLMSVTARADGEFRFAGLHAGEYKVFTRESMERDPLNNDPNGPAYGFPPRFFAAASDFATADTIQVRPGETITADLAPEKQRYYAVKVPVTGVELGAAPALGVSVQAQGHHGPGFELGFDRQSRAIAGSLPNGNYTIEAASYGQKGASGMVNIAVANGPVNGPPLAAAPNPSIEINFRQDLSTADQPPTQPDSRGGQHPPVFIQLQSAEEFQGGRGGQRAYLAQGDPPSLPNVNPGRYWVLVHEGTGYAASITSGTRDLLRAPLVVPFGASVPPIEITLRYDTGEIEAVVEITKVNSSASGSGNAMNAGETATAVQPISGLLVCIPLQGGPPRYFNSWSNGRYVLQQVPPGDYRILAFDTPQELEYRNPEAMRGYDLKGKVVHVAPGQKAQVSVQLIASE